MKLYYTPGACSLSPHIVVREAGLPIELIKTDIRAKKTEGGADYLKRNPLGYVPALELDDGSILTEGPAIVQYLADQVPETGLAPPAGTMDRYRLQSWLNFISTEIHKGFSPLFNPQMPEEAKTITRERLIQRFAHLESHLAGQAFLMGAKFTVADAYLFTVLGWTKPLKMDLTPYPNLVAYMERIRARPAVTAAMKAEGLIK